MLLTLELFSPEVEKNEIVELFYGTPNITYSMKVINNVTQEREILDMSYAKDSSTWYAVQWTTEVVGFVLALACRRMMTPKAAEYQGFA
ncbi:hypothetical protein HK099_004761 [Clydaea vesicula]|uniref:Uncharacterized protein n=1 Tax=Clydaea vesicula TaxID=447962 RepID=A0AAD5U1F6_9FUNG|nr:hypothetical protein HK099_004761 [Clydaea vesicula]KAJ3391902.1 hypothetical protein HDU92_008748 [Lobulomyces angularis]